jgi:hypothetical protein
VRAREEPVDAQWAGLNQHPDGKRKSEAIFFKATLELTGRKSLLPAPDSGLSLFARSEA